jgi:hypothetical protein
MDSTGTQLARACSMWVAGKLAGHLCSPPRDIRSVMCLLFGTLQFSYLVSVWLHAWGLSWVRAPTHPPDPSDHPSKLLVHLSLHRHNLYAWA